MTLPPAMIRVLVCEIRDGAMWPVCIAEGDDLVSGSKAVPIAARPTMMALRAMLAALAPKQRQTLLAELQGIEETPEAIPAPLALPDLQPPPVLSSATDGPPNDF